MGGSGDAGELGNALRDLRKRAKLTQQELASRLSIHYTMLGKMERGERQVSEAHAISVDAVLETGGTLVRLWRSGHQRRMPEWLRNTFLMERRATEIRHFQSLVIPGPLQTAPYARLLAKEGTGTDVEQVVQARVGRMAALRDAGVLEHLAYVVRETVFTDPIGDNKTMRDQLGHILKEMDAGVQLQLLPSNNRSGMKGFLPFQVLCVDNRWIGVGEHHEGGAVIDAPDGARRMLTQFGRLQAASLPTSATIDRLTEITETLYAGDLDEE